MQNFWVTNKEHYGMLWHFLEWSITHVLKKIATKTPSHGTHFEIVLKNHALRAQPTDYIVVSYLLADSCSLSVGCADFKNNCRLLAHEKKDSECNV